MGPAQFFEHLVAVGLDTQAHPVEALRPKTVEQPVGDGVGICLKGDLRVPRYIEVPADGGKNDGKGIGAEIAGSAAAEIDAVHLIAGGQGACFLDMGADGIQIAVHQGIVLAGQGVEVAVLALAPAEGNMDIDPQRGFIGFSRYDRHSKTSGFI